MQNLIQVADFNYVSMIEYITFDIWKQHGISVPCFPRMLMSDLLHVLHVCTSDAICCTDSSLYGKSFHTEQPLMSEHLSCVFWVVGQHSCLTDFNIWAYVWPDDNYLTGMYPVLLHWIIFCEISS